MEATILYNLIINKRLRRNFILHNTIKIAFYFVVMKYNLLAGPPQRDWTAQASSPVVAENTSLCL
jgi:hypothetical protein